MHRTRTRRRGFTMIEILVVMGIIAAVVAIALPAVLYAQRKARVTRTQADLYSIGLALEAYKAAYRDYPRFADPAADQNSANTAGNGTWLDYATDRGAVLLCRALIGPGPAGTGQTAKPGEDGYDGNGWRPRRSMMADGVTLSGAHQDAFLAPEKFKIAFNPNPASGYPMTDVKILDINGNPILYFPARPGAPVVTTAGSFVVSLNPAQASTGTQPPLYNAYDNSLDTTTGRPLLSVNDMQYMLGDVNHYGQIQPGESAVTTQPYLLWTAGLDGVFGLDANNKTDDVANFSFQCTR